MGDQRRSAHQLKGVPIDQLKEVHIEARKGRGEGRTVMLTESVVGSKCSLPPAVTGTSNLPFHPHPIDPVCTTLSAPSSAPLHPFRPTLFFVGCASTTMGSSCPGQVKVTVMIGAALRNALVVIPSSCESGLASLRCGGWQGKRTAEAAFAFFALGPLLASSDGRFALGAIAVEFEGVVGDRASLELKGKP